MKASPNTLVKMKKGPGRPKKSEAIIKDVKRRTKRLFNPEEKIAIVLEGLSGEVAEMRKQNGELKEALAEEILRNRFLKKLSKGME